MIDLDAAPWSKASLDFVVQIDCYDEATKVRTNVIVVM